MSLKITHKNSTSAGTPPAAGDIDVGEIAINAADAALYVKDTNGDVKNVVTDALFTQAGSGAQQRTVESKLRDVVSVKDFGAVGDGATDDTAAFTNALNAPGRIVVIPVGTYYIPSPSSIAGNTSKLWLAGGASFTTTSGGSGKPFSAVFYGEIIPGSYGPIAVANDNIPGVGENAGIRVTTGKFPTATPGANDRVAATFIADNIDKTTPGGGIWGANILALQSPYNSDGSTPATDSMIRGIEVEIAKVNGESNSDPWSGSAPYRANGIEIVGHSGSAYQPTAAVSTWANDTTGAKWWQIGAAFSRITKWGLLFAKNPGGSSDTGKAFGGNTAVGAAIRDESDSTSVLSVGGAHVNLIDLTSNPQIGTFIRTRTDANSTLTTRNFSDFSNSVELDSGNISQQVAEYTLSDRGTRRWGMQKLEDGRFQLYSFDQAKSFLLINQYSSTIDFGSNNLRNANTISVGSTGISDCAALEVNSSTKGLMFPRMTTTQRDAITGIANGLAVYNTTTNKLQVYANGTWADLH